MHHRLLLAKLCQKIVVVRFLSVNKQLSVVSTCAARCVAMR